MGKPLVENLYKTHSDWKVTITSRESHPSISDSYVYMIGNAKENSFLSCLLEERFDCIVDFMNYDFDEFTFRIESLLSATDHYIWFSSSRVYAESDAPLTEESPRLLEVSEDKEFLSTNRYALRKARQEDIIKNSGKRNYTIIRPYITYNADRLQLGILEKEQWLYRLLHNKPLVVSKDMLSKTTTLTYGEDVAEVIAELIAKDSPKGEVFQIAGYDTIVWKKLMDLYVNILRQYGFDPIIYTSDNLNAIEMLYEGGYNTIYDRNYDRYFDSSKIMKELGHPIHYTSIEDGITTALQNFLDGKKRFLRIDPAYEAYQDLLTNEVSAEADFQSDRDYEEYKKLRALSLDDVCNLDAKLIRLT